MKLTTKLFASVMCICLALACSSVSAQTKGNDYNLQRAREVLQEDGDEEQALKLISEQLKVTPNNTDAYFLAAKILKNQGSYGAALSAINSAIKYNKPKSTGLEASTLIWWKAVLYRYLDDLALSEKAYSEAIPLARKDNKGIVQDLQFEYANVLYNRDKFAEAETVYKRMLVDDETDATAMVGLARNMIHFKDYEGAKQMSLKAVNYAEDYSAAYKFLMRAYKGLGENDKAIDAGLKYMELDDDADPEEVVDVILLHKSYGVAKIKENVKHGDDPATWRYLLTDLYETTEEYDLALKEYNAIEEDFGKSSMINYYRSKCYSGLGLNELALSEIEICLEEDDKDVMSLERKAYYLRELGRYEESIKIVDDIIEERPTLNYAYYVKGLNYELKGDIDSAFECYDTGISIDDDYPYLYLMRGEILLGRGETDKAMKDFEQIVQKDTTYESGSCRQYALHFLGRDDEAIEWMDSLITKFPYEPGQYYDKACLLSRMGKADESVEALRKAFEKGFVRFVHMDHDDDMDLIRDRDDVKALVAQYKGKLQERIDKLGVDITAHSEKSIVEVPIVRRSGGTFDIECNVNGLPLNMIFDTGASDVTISKVEADFMLKNKYLSQSDIKGKQYYQIANGEISEGTVITLKEVKIGDAVLKNVNASVVKNQKAPLLLGESVLSKFGTFTVDNINSKLIIKQ